MDEFVQNELLSRRLAYLCCKKLNALYTNLVEINQSSEPKESGTDTQPPLPPSSSSATSGSNKDKKDIAVQTISFNEYLNCNHHRDIVMQLSCILQVIVLECPTALVWSGIGDNRSSSVWHGSPLDILPIAPSGLPMSSRMSQSYYKSQLKMAEENIRLRSRQAEGRWYSDKWQSSSIGNWFF